MKHSSLFRLAAITSFVLILFSCNSKDKKTEQSTTDSISGNTDTSATTSTTPETTTAPMGPANVMIVRHKIANYNKWLASYEAHDSMKTANGLHNYIIARGTTDSNMLLVALIMDDVAKAKTFAASPDLKDAMKKGGVVGAPQVMDFLEAVMNDTSALQSTTRLMVRHKVKDWDTWKKVFDSDKDRRMSNGLTDRVVAHTNGDPTNVTVVFAVSDEAKAKSMSESPELKAKMDSAGVVGKPDFFFYKVAKKY